MSESRGKQLLILFVCERGRLNALNDAPPVYAQLELEVARLVRVLESYRQGYQPITQTAA